MKPILIGVAAFLIATAAGAGAWKVLAPVPPAPPAEAHADSTEVLDVVQAGMGHGAPGGHGADTGHDADAGHGDPSDEDHTSEAGHHHADDASAKHEDEASHRRSSKDRKAGTPTVEIADDVHDNPSWTHADHEYREMGKILSAMNEVEAARFLVNLDDERTLGILRSMPIRDAAVILKLFPRRRARELKARLLDVEEKERR